jgi:hypothetical protein
VRAIIRGKIQLSVEHRHVTWGTGGRSGSDIGSHYGTAGTRQHCLRSDRRQQKDDQRGEPSPSGQLDRFEQIFY